MTIKLHHLRPAPGSKSNKIRVGRGEGGKRGKTAGRGTKGTKARNTVRVGFEGGQMPLHMRLPKLKGFTNPFRTEYQVVNVGDIARLFPEGGAITVEDLVARAQSAEPARQGSGRRRTDSCRSGDRRQVHRFRQGKDCCCRWFRHRAVSNHA